jgi:hypothetical protein
MAGLGLAPLVRVRPVDAPAGGGWLAQPVDGGRGAPSTTIENWSTT